MAIPADGEVGTVRAGALLSRTFEVFGRLFAPVALISAVFWVPSFLLIGWVAGQTTLDSPITVLLFSAGVGLVAGTIASGATISCVVRSLHGDAVDLGGAFRVALACLVPLIAASLLQALATVVGLVLLVVPGIMVACALYVTAPALVVERCGVLDALNRSVELTRGSRLPIFGVAFVLWILGQLGEALGNALGTLPAVGVVLQLALSSLLIGLGSCAGGVVYHDLRVAKEGVGTDELAKIFA